MPSSWRPEHIVAAVSVSVRVKARLAKPNRSGCSSTHEQTAFAGLKMGDRCVGDGQVYLEGRKAKHPRSTPPPPRRALYSVPRAPCPSRRHV